MQGTPHGQVVGRLLTPVGLHHPWVEYPRRTLQSSVSVMVVTFRVAKRSLVVPKRMWLVGRERKPFSPAWPREPAQ